MKTSENRKYIKIRGANEHNLKNIDVVFREMNLLC